MLSRWKLILPPSRKILPPRQITTLRRNVWSAFLRQAIDFEIRINFIASKLLPRQTIFHSTHFAFKWLFEESDEKSEKRSCWRLKMLFIVLHSNSIDKCYTQGFHFAFFMDGEVYLLTLEPCKQACALVNREKRRRKQMRGNAAILNWVLLWKLPASKVSKKNFADCWLLMVDALCEWASERWEVRGTFESDGELFVWRCNKSFIHRQLLSRWKGASAIEISWSLGCRSSFSN